MTPALKPMLTTMDVAKILGVSRSTVDRLRGAGDLSAVKIGGGVRYPQESVEHLMRHGTARGDRPRGPSTPSLGGAPEPPPLAYRVA